MTQAPEVEFSADEKPLYLSASVWLRGYAMGLGEDTELTRNLMYVSELLLAAGNGRKYDARPKVKFANK